MFNFFKAIALIGIIQDRFDKITKYGHITAEEALGVITGILPKILELAGLSKSSIGDTIIYKK